MLRTVIEDSAVSAAKAYSHAAVEPRHVIYALARCYKERDDCKDFFAQAKRALEPSGSNYGAPAIGDEAKAMLDTLKSDDDGVAALKKAFANAGDAAAAGPGASQAQTEEQAASPAPAASSTPTGKETVADVLADLDALIGLGAVKAQLRKVIAVVQANTEREKAGLKPVFPGLHLVFTGPPGTGKTTVARIVARLYAAAGALRGANFTEATRSDLVAGYVGQTAIKTQEAINRSKPGVLFIDEAYALTPRHESDFGYEAIATVVKAMEDYRSEFAVIVAGYEDEMNDFINSNPGLRSRFKTFIACPDYSAAELAEIFTRMVADVGLTLGEGAQERAAQIFNRAAGREDFGNARFARSLFEQSYARMAARAAADGAVTLEELTTLTANDIDDDLSMLKPERARIGF
jgi:stage V sporulation protein K